MGKKFVSHNGLYSVYGHTIYVDIKGRKKYQPVKVDKENLCEGCDLLGKPLCDALMCVRDSANTYILKEIGNEPLTAEKQFAAYLRSRRVYTEFFSLAGDVDYSLDVDKWISNYINLKTTTKRGTWWSEISRGWINYAKENKL